MRHQRLGLALGAAVLTLAACEQGSDPAGVEFAPIQPAFLAVGDPITVGELWVCKDGPAGTYDFTVSTTSGTMNYTSAVVGGAFTVAAGDCVLIADNNIRGTADVTEVTAGLPATVVFMDVLRYRHRGQNIPGGDTGVPVAEPPASASPTMDTGFVGPDNGRLLLYTNVDAPSTGCTLTLGYWKTHNDSFQGGAPADPEWANIGAAKELTAFFGSGMTWFDVFWTPVGGNAYYNLAHQYMAAKLNYLAGASAPTAVTDALTHAESLFNTYSAAQIAGLKGNDSLRQDFIATAGTLGSYNEGDIGPGHCGD